MMDAAAPDVFDRPSCQSVDCRERPQQLVEIQLAGGSSERLAFCMIHTFVVVSRDAGEHVEVVWP